MGGAAVPAPRRAHPRRRRGRQRTVLRGGGGRGDPVRRLGRAAALVGGLPAGPVRGDGVDRRDPAAPVDGAGTARLSGSAGRVGDDPGRGPGPPGKPLLQEPFHVDRVVGSDVLRPSGGPAVVRYQRSQAFPYLDRLPVRRAARYHGHQLRRPGVLLPDPHAPGFGNLRLPPAGQVREGLLPDRRNQLVADDHLRSGRLSPAGVPGNGRADRHGPGRPVAGPRASQGGGAQGGRPGAARRRQRRDHVLPRRRSRSRGGSSGDGCLALDNGHAGVDLPGLRRRGAADLHRHHPHRGRGRPGPAARADMRPRPCDPGDRLQPGRNHRSDEPVPRLPCGPRTSGCS